MHCVTVVLPFHYFRVWRCMHCIFIDPLPSISSMILGARMALLSSLAAVAAAPAAVFFLHESSWWTVRRGRLLNPWPLVHDGVVYAACEVVLPVACRHQRGNLLAGARSEVALGALEGRATRQHILRRYGCVAAQLDGVLMSPQGGAGSSAGCARCAVGARRLSGVLSACGHFDSFDVLTLLCPLLTRLHRQCSMHSC